MTELVHQQPHLQSSTPSTENLLFMEISFGDTDDEEEWILEDSSEYVEEESDEEEEEPYAEDEEFLSDECAESEDEDVSGLFVLPSKWRRRERSDIPSEFPDIKTYLGSPVPLYRRVLWCSYWF